MFAFTLSFYPTAHRQQTSEKKKGKGDKEEVVFVSLVAFYVQKSSKLNRETKRGEQSRPEHGIGIMPARAAHCMFHDGVDISI